MRRIATNAALDQLRADRVRAARDAVQAEPRDARSGGSLDPPSHNVADSIRAAFDRLPPRLAVVATLALIEERPYAEIAEALDVPIGTVKSRVFRATRLLREELVRLGVTP
jgi:RNA polymerase sigma-70 factor (ECF subfamily)